MAKDLCAVNKLAKKALKKKPTSTATKTKKPAVIISKTPKSSVKVRLAGKSLVKRAVVVLVKEVVTQGVAVTQTSSRTINLLQHFR